MMKIAREPRGTNSKKYNHPDMLTSWRRRTVTVMAGMAFARSQMTTITAAPSVMGLSSLPLSVAVAARRATHHRTV
jgi:hypothetical protein